MARKQALIALCLAVAGLNSLGEESRPPADPLALSLASKADNEKPAREKVDAGKTARPEREDADRDKPNRPFSPEAEKAREAFKKLSPEERERWIKHFREWSEMSPEKKKALLDREEFFRRRIHEDIDKAIEQTGLPLNEEQKKQFAQRYMEERRKIEEELRKQMDEVRRPKVQAMVEKLKEEFAAQAKPEPKPQSQPTK
jgi:hypothetical protein